MTPQDNEIFSETEWASIAEDLELSPRQAQITRSVFGGLSDKQIAAELRISVPTVRTHLTRLFGRLNVQDRYGVVLCVVRSFRAGCEKVARPRKRCHRSR